MNKRQEAFDNFISKVKGMSDDIWGRGEYHQIDREGNLRYCFIGFWASKSKTIKAFSEIAVSLEALSMTEDDIIERNDTSLSWPEAKRRILLYAQDKNPDLEFNID